MHPRLELERFLHSRRPIKHSFIASFLSSSAAASASEAAATAAGTAEHTIVIWVNSIGNCAAAAAAVAVAA